MKKIRWGIIGTGNIAHSFARDFSFVKHGTFSAVASRSKENAKKFADEFDVPIRFDSYDALYTSEDIDAVYIATPHNFHFKNASDALQNGKAVLCEKPIAIDPGECRQLMGVAKAANTYLMEAMWTYFLPPILQTQKWIEEGKIGSIKCIKADFGFKANINTEPRLFDPALAGGALLDIGIYPIALASLIISNLPEKVTVFHKKTASGVDAEETIIFEYVDGSIANLSASILYAMPNEALIIGDEGFIRIPDFFMAKKCFLYKNGELKDQFVDQSKSTGYNYEIDSVNMDLIQGKKESDVLPHSNSLRIQELMAIVQAQF